MTAKVINDPSALGWELDPDTGRWTWGGSDGGSGGGGTPFPEAPLDGNQYGRQNRSWTEIVHSGDGGPTEVTTANVLLENPTRLPNGLVNQQDANSYIAESLDKLIDEDGNVIKGGIEEAPSDSSIYGRKNEGWVVVPTGGGGGDVDLSGYYTAVQCDSKYEPKFTKNTAFNKNFGSSSGTVAQGNHNHSGVYQPAGSYAASNHNHNGVYQPAGSYAAASHTHNYAAVGASYTKAESDAKYELKGAGGGGDPFPWTGGIAQFYKTGASSAAIEINSAASGRGPEILMKNTADSSSTKSIRANQGALEVINSSYGNLIWKVDDAGNMTATGDVLAYSDERLKENIDVVGTGLLDQVRGVEFNWKKDGARSSGVIAQDIQKVFPHLVSESTGTDPEDRSESILQVNYAGLTAYLIEELKECRQRIKALEEAK